MIRLSFAPIFVALALLAGLASAQPPKTPADAWELQVETGPQRQVTGVFWSKGGQRVEALSKELLAVVVAEPKVLRKADKMPHAVLILPFGSDNASLGDIVVLKGGETTEYPAKGDKVVGKEPVDAIPTKTGFFFTRESGRFFTLEHYDLATKKAVELHKIPLGDGAGTYRAVLTSQSATVIQGEKSLEFTAKGKKGDASTVFSELGQSQTDLIEGKFGGVDLVKKAKDGLLDPDLTEEETVRKMADTLLRKKTQRSSLVWGNTGTDTKGIVHLLAKRIAEAKEDDPTYGSLKGWRLYQVSWARLNAEGLVDVSTNKSTELCDAVKGRKAILFFDQVEGLVGLGSDRGGRSDAASVFQGHMKAGEVLLIGATSSDGIGTLRSKREFLEQFTEMPMATPTGEKLIAKLRSWADAKGAEKKVVISDDVLRAVVDVTNRFQVDRGQPEKSIAALETLVTEHSPLRKLPEDADRDSVTPKKLTVAQVNTWGAGVTRIATLNAETNQKLTKFLTSPAFEAAVKKRMTGQDRARTAVRDALITMAKSEKSTDALGAEIGMEMLLFTGPSGTGKSFLHEVISKVLTEQGIDLPYETPLEGSNFVDKGSTAILLGAPPSFTGFDTTGQGGLLYQMVKRSPQAIFVLEEFDKCADEVYQVLMSFLDTGVVQNSAGNKARFTRGLFIMTANFGVIGSGGVTARNKGIGDANAICDQIDRWDKHHLFKKGDPLHKEDEEVAKWSKQRLAQELFTCLQTKKLVNTQVLGRISLPNFVVFHHFTKPEIETIRDQQIDKLLKAYVPKKAASLAVSPDVRSFLLDEGWGHNGQLTFDTGARGIVSAVKSELQKKVELFTTEQAETTPGKTWKVEIVVDDESKRKSLVVHHKYAKAELESILEAQLEKDAETYEESKIATKVTFSPALRAWLLDEALPIDTQFSTNIGPATLLKGINEANKALLAAAKGTEKNPKAWILDVETDGLMKKRAVARLDK